MCSLPMDLYWNKHVTVQTCYSILHVTVYCKHVYVPESSILNVWDIFKAS